MSAKYYNAKDLGAVGDGTTLDSSAIQAQLTHAAKTVTA